MLHILGGMDSLSDGSYRYEGMEVSKFSADRLNVFRRDHISFVFQNASLMKYYSVAENVEMPLLSKNLNKKERKKIVQEKMEAVGIDHLAKKLPGHLSGGEQQRCAIARALASGNDLLLADEPTGALDQNTGKEIMEVFKQVHVLS